MGLKKLLLSDGMMYSIIACATIGTDCVENTNPVVYGMLSGNGRVL
jgi:hypothetical protein